MTRSLREFFPRQSPDLLRAALRSVPAGRRNGMIRVRLGQADIRNIRLDLFSKARRGFANIPDPDAYRSRVPCRRIGPARLADPTAAKGDEVPALSPPRGNLMIRQIEQKVGSCVLRCLHKLSNVNDLKRRICAILGIATNSAQEMAYPSEQ